MSISSKHPLYSAMIKAWKTGRDSYGGETVIKEGGTTYLPATAGQRLDGLGGSSDGQKDYDAMKDRAHYPDNYENAVETAIGMMHKKDSNILLPESMEYLRETASDVGEDLQMIMQRINTEQLVIGRVGIFGDIRVVNSLPRIVISLYDGEDGINWDDSLSDEDSSKLRFAVLDESGYVLQGDYSWELETKYKALALVTPTGEQGSEGETGYRVIQATEEDQPEEVGVYAFASLDEEDLELSGADWIIPNATGNTSAKIPFTFVNAKDMSSTPDRPPLRSLAALMLSIYRQEADYKQNLHNQSQDTLVVMGGNLDEDDEVRVGSGSRLDLPVSGKAEYIGVRAEGITAQKDSLVFDYERANQKIAGFLDDNGSAESGDALRIRVAGKTANLPQIAKAGAAGLEYVLRVMAEMVGANPEEVKVIPNLEFADVSPDTAAIKQLIESKNLGAPISDQTIFDFMREQGITERELEDEMNLILSEVPRI